MAFDVDQDDRRGFGQRQGGFTEADRTQDDQGSQGDQGDFAEDDQSGHAPSGLDDGARDGNDQGAPDRFAERDRDGDDQDQNSF